MSIAAVRGVPAAVEPVESRPVQGVGLADAVARCVQAGGRFLHLTDVAGESLVAVCDAPHGVQAWRAPYPRRGRQVVPRLSAHGVRAALHAESVLAEAGVRWASPSPEATVQGRGVFTFPLGPVRADVAESAAWRLLVMGDEVLGLRLGFGYKRRGLEAAMEAAGPERGAALAERVTGTSPVAHALAYSQAWEGVFGVEVPEAAIFWRGVLAELERMHSHLGDLGALANSTGLPVAAAELLLLKEEILQLCGELFGHRYLRGCVVPGGLAVEPGGGTAPGLSGRLRPLGERFGAVVRALDGSGSFLDRLHGAGRVPKEVALLLGPVGPVGRACGLPYDVRLDRPYGGYRLQPPRRVVEDRADAWARYRVRVGEVEASLRWLDDQHSVPTGSVRHRSDFDAPARAGGEATVFVSRVEAPRGELVYFVRPPVDGRPAWVRLRPPSVVDWQVLPYAVAENNVLQDVPIIDASFALSVAAMDR